MFVTMTDANSKYLSCKMKRQMQTCIHYTPYNTCCQGSRAWNCMVFSQFSVKQLWSILWNVHAELTSSSHWWASLYVWVLICIRCMCPSDTSNHSPSSTGSKRNSPGLFCQRSGGYQQFVTPSSCRNQCTATMDESRYSPSGRKRQTTVNCGCT